LIGNRGPAAERTCAYVDYLAIRVRLASRVRSYVGRKLGTDVLVLLGAYIIAIASFA
jgi:hypothetical protein